MDGQLTTGQTVGLRANQGTSGWVAAEWGGGGEVNANRATQSTWETFTVVKVAGSAGSAVGSGDAFALRTWNGANYVCAEYGGAAPLVANRTAIGQWETFTAVFVPRAYP